MHNLKRTEAQKIRIKHDKYTHRLRIPLTEPRASWNPLSQWAHRTKTRTNERASGATKIDRVYTTHSFRSCNAEPQRLRTDYDLDSELEFSSVILIERLPCLALALCVFHTASPRPHSLRGPPHVPHFPVALFSVSVRNRTFLTSRFCACFFFCCCSCALLSIHTGLSRALIHRQAGRQANGGALLIVCHTNTVEWSSQVANYFNLVAVGSGAVRSARASQRVVAK